MLLLERDVDLDWGKVDAGILDFDHAERDIA